MRLGALDILDDFARADNRHLDSPVPPHGDDRDDPVQLDFGFVIDQDCLVITEIFDDENGPYIVRASNARYNNHIIELDNAEARKITMATTSSS